MTANDAGADGRREISWRLHPHTITLEIPANVIAGYRIGVGLNTSQPYNGTVYIDSVEF